MLTCWASNLVQGQRRLRVSAAAHVHLGQSGALLGQQVEEALTEEVLKLDCYFAQVTEERQVSCRGVGGDDGE